VNTKKKLCGAPRLEAAPLLKIPAPFVKWAGGKGQLLSTFEKFFPVRFNKYYEPFIGGGAVFFHLAGTRPGLKATISDLNEELINCYGTIRDDVDALIAALQKHKNERDYFYRIRSQDVSKLNEIERAARLIYLNKTCFNGLYRVNSRGHFNVPFGSYKNPRTCDEENLRAVSQALRKTKVLCRPFEKVVQSAEPGDFVYLDPPYQPISSTSNFTGYTRGCFGIEDQVRLAEIVKELDRRGCVFMLSNSDNEFVRDLYKGFRQETVYATRAINCRGDRRGKITELLVLNY